MDRLPSDLLRCVAQTLLDELLAFALPPFGAPPERDRTWYELYERAARVSDNLRALASTSTAWADVAVPLLRTLLVVGVDDDARLRQPALRSAVRILVGTDLENWDDSTALERLTPIVEALPGVHTVMLANDKALREMWPPLPACATLVLEQCDDAGFLSALPSALPSLRRFEVFTPDSGFTHRRVN